MIYIHTYIHTYIQLWLWLWLWLRLWLVLVPASSASVNESVCRRSRPEFRKKKTSAAVAKARIVLGGNGNRTILEGEHNLLFWVGG